MALDQRPRGILSEADRQYLNNPDEYSKQAGYERRQAIIQRIHEALHDFPLLVSELDGDSRAQAFEDGNLENKDHTINVLSEAFAFLYLGITDTVEPTDLAKDAVEGIAADGVRRAYNRRGVSVADVEVNVEVTLGEPLSELEERDELSYPEAKQLLESGRLSGLPAEERLEILRDSIQSERADKVGAFSTLSSRGEDTDSNAGGGEENDPYDPTEEFED
jgi:hypothetical protein